MDAPSFSTREAGMENTQYFDSNVIFTLVGTQWESEAFNVIYNYAGNSFYSVTGWMPTVYINRFRTNQLIVKLFMKLA